MHRTLLKSLLYRLLIAIPSLVLLSLIVFYAATHLPGDALTQKLNATENTARDPFLEYRLRQQIRHQEGLDLPLFYFAFSGLGDCDTLPRIPSENIRAKASDLNTLTGQWTATEQAYVNTLVALEFETSDSLRSLLTQKENELYSQAIANKHPWKRYIPNMHFYSDNQFHRFLFGNGIDQKGWLRGDMGHSLRSGAKVSSRIFSSIKISLLLSILSILLAYLFSIPFAVHSILNPQSKRSTFVRLLQFTLPALPTFFVAGLLLFLFANPDNIALFPSSGMAPSNAQHIWQSIPYLILPILTYSYTHFVFVTRTVQEKVKQGLEMPFASFLRMNGISEKQIAYHYALPLSYVPLLQLLAHAVPASIAGAIIIESIFSIPGMGALLFDSIATHDYPIIIAIFTLVAFFTWLSYLISDILGMLLDRRLLEVSR
jgi:peptide/nickel transport system permease protein